MWLVRIVPFCREGNGDAQAGLGGEGFDVGAAGEVGLDRRRLAAVIGGTGTGGLGRRSGRRCPLNSCAMPSASTRRAIQELPDSRTRRSAAIRCQHPQSEEPFQPSYDR